MKIYLSPSDQKENPYSYGGYNEEQVCNQIAKAAYDALARNGYEVKLGTADTYQARVKESNDWEADIHIPIHTNAGGGDGTVVFCASQSVANRYVKAVYESVAAVTPGEDDGIRKMNNMYEINHTTSICIYVECEFHDNPTLAKWIVEHANELGEAIAKGICNGDGKTYQGHVSAGTIKYTVQVGAFSSRKNAENLVDQLKSKGFDAFIKEK